MYISLGVDYELVYAEAYGKEAHIFYLSGRRSFLLCCLAMKGAISIDMLMRRRCWHRLGLSYVDLRLC